MPGNGQPPKKDPIRRNLPKNSEWDAAPGYGWQHGTTPKAPKGLTPTARAVWTTWMSAWFASCWTPELLPQLNICIKLYADADKFGDTKVTTEALKWMDSLGITPMGQQKLRWLPPKEDAAPASKPKTGGYRKLRAVG